MPRVAPHPVHLSAEPLIKNIGRVYERFYTKVYKAVLVTITYWTPAPFPMYLSKHPSLHPILRTMTAETKRPTSPPEPTSSPSPPQSLEGNADAASHVDFEETKALSETKPGWQVFLVALGALMSLFLVALDRTIVSTVRYPS